MSLMLKLAPQRSWLYQFTSILGGNLMVSSDGICLKKVSESICVGGVCSEVPSLKQQKKSFFLCVVNCFPLSTPFLIFIESLPTKVKILFQNWIADDCQSLLNGFWLPPIDRICQDLGERICLIVKNKFDCVYALLLSCIGKLVEVEVLQNQDTSAYIGVWDFLFSHYLILKNLHFIKLQQQLVRPVNFDWYK